MRARGEPEQLVAKRTLNAPGEPEQLVAERTMNAFAEETEEEVGDYDDESLWDIVFDSFLIEENEETFLEVLDYIDRNHDNSEHCYEDILETMYDHRNGRLFAMLAKVIHNFQSDDFEKLTTIIYELWHTDPPEDHAISPISMAAVIRSICKNASSVSQRSLSEFQQFVYSIPWPLDVPVAILLLQIERHLNKLLLEQRHDFASGIPVDFEGEEADEIEIEKMLIMHELSNEDRISLTQAENMILYDLPYRLRSELGDPTEIEDDLIPIMEEELANLPPNCDAIDEDYNVIIN